MHPTHNQVTDPVTTPTPEVARTLRDAALYLTRKGWIQGAYYDQTATSFTPAACVVGAIGMVCYGGPVDAPAQMFDDPGWGDFEAALTYLDRYLADRSPGGQYADGWGSAYDYNDAKGRTQEQVIAILRAAAEAADETDGSADDWTPANGMGMTQAEIDAIDAEFATPGGTPGGAA